MAERHTRLDSGEMQGRWVITANVITAVLRKNRRAGRRMARRWMRNSQRYRTLSTRFTTEELDMNQIISDRPLDSDWLKFSLRNGVPRPRQALDGAKGKVG